ncbi:unnamed protein product [Durusdinium trenchii]|uniref:Uncharacterized protein n=2 Tax=Durusdinium trenchii TaxID=1381693 RepID=A0ABP0IEU8_9DINO
MCRSTRALCPVPHMSLLLGRRWANHFVQRADATCWMHINHPATSTWRPSSSKPIHRLGAMMPKALWSSRLWGKWSTDMKVPPALRPKTWWPRQRWVG